MRTLFLIDSCRSRSIFWSFRCFAVFPVLPGSPIDCLRFSCWFAGSSGFTSCDGSFWSVVVFRRSKFSSFCQGVLTLCPTRNVVKQVGRKSMSFLVAFLYCYAFDACTIFLRRSYVHTYIRSMIVNLDTLADGALIVVSPTIGDALNVGSLTLSCKW